MDWKQREREEIKLDEGLRLKAYKDTVGVWTDGYGNTKHVIPNSTITIEKANQDLDINFAEACDIAERFCAIWDRLSGPRKGVLVNMAFNLGEVRLDQFRGFESALNFGDYTKAAAEMKDSLWYKQVKSRADRLIYRMETNEYKER